jgi:hypothetical protein
MRDNAHLSRSYNFKKLISIQPGVLCPEIMRSKPAVIRRLFPRLGPAKLGSGASSPSEAPCPLSYFLYCIMKRIVSEVLSEEGR